jgi:YbgC/YbaW family acyl-CoA thioester hydrolase
MTATALPRRGDFRLAHRLRVRWVEVDLQQIVFNGHYLMYIDTAMGAYWRALGLPYQDAMVQLGGDLYVRQSTLEYHASARYDEMLEVGVRCEAVGRSSIRFTAAVFRDHRLLTHGTLVYVYAAIDATGTRSAQPVPEVLRQTLQGFEAGEAMLAVQVGGWAELGEAAHALRHDVFVQEQHIPAALEADAADAEPGTLHALVRNRLGQPLGTGRLLAHAPGVAKIGRMAVRAPVRGSAVGRTVLQALVDAARARGDREVLLHAQDSAVDFYRRAGFVPQGSPFEEAEIGHQGMVRAL